MAAADISIMLVGTKDIFSSIGYKTCGRLLSYKIRLIKSITKKKLLCS
ncbi:hypothetical protein [Methanobacterium sp.]|nr:hypothetical protein [Methanobacterium sp.]MBI5458118.1 hypothetical protein [Methanobacterium sp.]